VSAEPVLVVDDVSLDFSGVRALDGVSFTIQPGELFAVIGPNGAGKTSIFNVLSGVFPPTSGSVTFAGRDISHARPHDIAAAGMARTFQNIELFGNLDLGDNLMVGRHRHMRYSPWLAPLWTRRVRREEDANRELVEEIIDFLELQHYRDKPVRLLPYGVQKRIELGRALAMEPALLLLDEPVAGMNTEETEDTARFILDIRADLGIPILLVEHDMGLVMDLADRVLAMEFGKPIACDVPSAIQRHPGVIASYLGHGHDEANRPAAGDRGLAASGARGMDEAR
jgi:branched-chain amino acid transport system ATP-binding protein